MIALPRKDDRPVRVLVADDHPILLEALTTLLGAAGAEVVGSADNGAGAVELARALTPDVIVMDLRMPGVDGTEATRRVLSDSPDVPIVTISAHGELSWVRTAFAAGARAYVLKEHAYDDLVVAIDAVLGGREFVSPHVVGGAQFMRQRRVGAAEP